MAWQEDALKGILALRAENSGTLTGMTMLEIMEGVIRLVKNSKEKTGHQPEREESVDADVENSSADAEFQKISRKRKIQSYFNEYALPYSEEEVDVSKIIQPG